MRAYYPALNALGLIIMIFGLLMGFPLGVSMWLDDGATLAYDLPMIKAAGLGIAFHAKPKVNEQAEVTIRHADLMGVFCILSGSMNQK